MGKTEEIKAEGEESLDGGDNSQRIEPWLQKFCTRHNIDPEFASTAFGKKFARQMAAYEDEMGIPKELLPTASHIFGGFLDKIEKAHANEEITPQQASKFLDSLLKGQTKDVTYALMNGNGDKFKKIFELELKAYEELLRRANIPQEQWPIVFEHLMPELKQDVEKVIQDLLDKKCTVADIIWCASSDRNKDMVDTTKEVAAKVIPVIKK